MIKIFFKYIPLTFYIYLRFYFFKIYLKNYYEKNTLYYNYAHT